MEVTQIKGDGEAHPLLSPDDEFADYETWDKASFGPQPKTPEMLPREYAREALKNGLLLEQRQQDMLHLPLDVFILDSELLGSRHMREALDQAKSVRSVVARR